jgi:hypothetical protein
MKTAVEWFALELYEKFEMRGDGKVFDELYNKAKEMEKQRMIDLVQHLKDYTGESNNVLGFDEREASEFVDIFYNETFNNEENSSNTTN